VSAAIGDFGVVFGLGHDQAVGFQVGTLWNIERDEQGFGGGLVIQPSGCPMCRLPKKGR
jgi:hypothetical protein